MNADEATIRAALDTADWVGDSLEALERLVAENERLRAERDEANAAADHWARSLSAQQEENDRLREGFSAPNGRVANYWYDRLRRIEEAARNVADGFEFLGGECPELRAALADQPPEGLAEVWRRGPGPRVADQPTEETA